VGVAVVGVGVAQGWLPALSLKGLGWARLLLWVRVKMVGRT